MALEKIQNLIKKISDSNRVKKVIADVQNVKSDLENQIKKLNTDEAVRRYKIMMKKAVEKEKQLQSEILHIVSVVKKSAADVEKNFKAYKSKAEAQRAKLEKLIKAELHKAKSKSVKKAKPATRRPTTKKKSAKTRQR